MHAYAVIPKRYINPTRLLCLTPILTTTHIGTYLSFANLPYTFLELKKMEIEQK